MSESEYWLRNLLDAEEISQLSGLFHSGKVGKRVSVHSLEELSAWKAIFRHFPEFRPVRVVAFAKTASRSWTLPWHQDRVIALKEKHEFAGFANWTQKMGGWHCEPPLTLLEGMLFLRIFLDDVEAEDGGMEYASGSHLHGLVSQKNVETVALAHPCQVETANAGDVLALPMLTLHRSNKAKSDRMRRVLRVDLCRSELPAPLQWAD